MNFFCFLLTRFAYFLIPSSLPISDLSKKDNSYTSTLNIQRRHIPQFSPPTTPVLKMRDRQSRLHPKTPIACVSHAAPRRGYTLRLKMPFSSGFCCNSLHICISDEAGKVSRTFVRTRVRWVCTREKRERAKPNNRIHPCEF